MILWLKINYEYTIQKPAFRFINKYRRTERMKGSTAVNLK
jgi:hypothetical protein